MSEQPCPCCGHDQVAVEMVIGAELEENRDLKAKVAALEASLENARGLIKTLALSGDERKGCGGTIFCDGTQDHRKGCPVDAAMRKHEGGVE